MLNMDDPNDDGPMQIDKVLLAELSRVQPSLDQSKADSMIKIFNLFSSARLKALCFSGGGIRSATFGLGILESLAEHKLLEKFDYLSTVSGGGYLGTWLSAWNRVEVLNKLEEDAKEQLEREIAQKEKQDEPQEPEQDSEAAAKEKELQMQIAIDNKVREMLYSATGLMDDGIKKIQHALAEGAWAEWNRGSNNTNGNGPKTNPEPRPIRHLREHSNYMTPKVGLMSADMWALLGIYIRNLFLHWTIYIPLIAAALLMPRALYSLMYTIVHSDWPPFVYGTMLVFGIVCAGVSLAFVGLQLPSRHEGDEDWKSHTDGDALLWGVLPLFIHAFCSVCWWLHYVFKDLPIVCPLPFDDAMDLGLGWLILFSISTFLIGFGFFVICQLYQRHKTGKGKIFYWRNFVFAFLSSVAGGMVLWAGTKVVPVVLSVLDSTDHHPFPLLVCIAVPIFLAVYLVQSALYTGLTSSTTTDDDREWMARFGGWILLVSIVWFLVNGFVLLWPELINALFTGWFALGWGLDGILASVTTLITIGSGVIALFGGFSSKLPMRKNPDGNKKVRLLSTIPQIASAIFISAIIIAIAYITAEVIGFIVSGLPKHWPIFLATPIEQLPNIGALELSENLTFPFIAICIFLLTLLGSAMALFISVNRFSLHGAYRDRLIRAYLGASNLRRKPNRFTGFDETDNRQLHRLKRQRPFHVLNATLNLVSSANNLAWQNRKATAFTMTPLHCGSESLGYRQTNEYSRTSIQTPCPSKRNCNKIDKACEDECEIKGKALSLGTAMAISGAAADPNMGYISSALVSFVMSLFNIRLGWWLGNTSQIGESGDFSKCPRVKRFFEFVLGEKLPKYYQRSDPAFAVFPLLNETFGRTSGERRYLNITDGGHFENLAFYEMIRRRCELIVVSDAAADAGFTFGELSNAVEKCRVDLGVHIKVPANIDIYARNADEQIRRNGKRFFLAEIIYPEQSKRKRRRRSWLLYCRPTLTGREPIDIQHYANSNPSFPHQSTGDQFFDERQFEAYRKLGYLTFDEIMKSDEVRELFER